MELFKLNELRQHQFLQVPKELLYNQRYKSLSSDAKLLYGLLLDRMELSRDNNWINEKDEIYLIFTRKNIEIILSISHPTCVKAFNQLTETSLIKEVKQGLGKPNLIFIAHIIYETPKTIGDTQTLNNLTLRNKDNSLQEVNNLNSNKTNIIKTDNLEEEETILKTDVSQEIIKIYKNSISNKISNMEFKILAKLQSEIGEELLNKAIILATIKNGKNLGYIQTVIEDWRKKGFTTLEQVDIYLSKWSYMNKKAKENRTKQTKDKAENKTYGKNESIFNNFEQREYDYDNLEKKLLGWKEK